MKHYLIAYQRVPGDLSKVITSLIQAESFSEVVTTLKTIAPDAYSDPLILAIVEIHPIGKDD